MNDEDRRQETEDMSRKEDRRSSYSDFCFCLLSPGFPFIFPFIISFH
ncbi:MAG: hypothetical protein QOG71_3523 [Pyrinomonadaceae bacterium]|nr:hypothetical protein [Pyrinomonadaceae bacterium]